MSDFDRLFETLFASSIGFDRFNPQFRNAPTYPPHNVVKVDDTNYIITVAVAGFEEEDLNIETKEGVLTIHGKGNKDTDTLTYLHKGLAKRQFKLSFALDTYIEVAGAVLKNGLLHIKLVRNVPEEKLPKKISIEVNGELPMLTKA